AYNLHHDHVDTEHLLLALLRAPDSAVGPTLVRLRLNPDDLREEVLYLLVRKPAGSGPSVLGLHYERFTGRACHVLRLANQEAQCRTPEYTGPEPILLGLVREGSPVPTDILANLERLTAIAPLARFRHRAFNRLLAFRARAGEPLADRQI